MATETNPAGNEHPVVAPTKLIEVALPLEKIDEAAAREKSIRHGHPSTLHLWWARRPLAAARAVIFAQMVDDPSAHPERFPTEEDQATERKRLFDLIEELVKWENTKNEELLEQARQEIRKCWRWTCEANADHPEAETLFNPEKLPGFHDPFAGGGALPLEAQRLGLEAHASDLNPVAVLINKAMIEIPPKFAGMPPVNPESRSKDNGELVKRTWKGAEGLAEDIRYYGKWMRDRAKERIGHLYPPVKITPEMVAERPDLAKYEGRELTVIAWLWARTVKSPNPAFSDVDVPLVSNFMLSTKKGKEAYVEPIVEGRSYQFKVRVGAPPDIEEAKKGTKLGRGASFKCVMSGVPIDSDYIKTQGKAGRMGSRLMAIVCSGDSSRLYVDPIEAHERIADKAEPNWRPDAPLPNDSRNFWTLSYGLTTFGDLFTRRQLVSLDTFSDLVSDAITQAGTDAVRTSVPHGHENTDSESRRGEEYGESVGLYLTFALSKQADLGNSLCRWEPVAQCPRQLFGRQAIPMIWDFAESNPLGTSSGAWTTVVDGVEKAFRKAFGVVRNGPVGTARQIDATSQSITKNTIVSTDPPYYDNISYADLSDFFYVWARRALRDRFPDCLSTIVVPKEGELIASVHRHGTKESADSYFLSGMKDAMAQIASRTNHGFPVTIYYAFKQAEKTHEGIASTGWETFLDGVLSSGLMLTGTLPLRTENSSRMIGQGANALASSIVLVCRQRPKSAGITTRGRFIQELQDELEKAVAQLQKANTPPVDMQQAAIGPGMAVFSKYREVREAKGRMSVHDALVLINQTLDELLNHAESELDGHTRWAVAWFEQFGVKEADYGTAETIANAKNVSVDGMVNAGFLYARAGKVRLLRRDEMSPDWRPSTDTRFTVWEAVQHLVRVLADSGESAAADMYGELTADQREGVRDLCYRLYNTCERHGWNDEALGYNRLIAALPSINLKSQSIRRGRPQAQTLFEE